MKNLIAIGVLVVLGIVAAITFREKPNTEKEKVKESITPVDADKVDTIKVVRQEGIGDKKEEEKYTLKKTKDTWRMVEPVDFAVVASTVESMLKALSELRVIDIISEKPESHAKFAVDDKDGVKVTAMAGNTVLLDIIIGNAKGGITFARLPGKNAVYRMKGSFKFNLDRSIKTLRDKTIVQVEMDDLDKVTFTQGNDNLTLAREGEGNDVTVKPVDQEIKDFDDKKAAGVVRSAIRLNAVGFVDDALPAETTGLDDAADKYELVGKKDDKPYTATVFLGKKMDDKAQVYARSSESDQIYLISQYTADRLRAKAANFVKEEKKDDKNKTEASKPPAPNLPPGIQLPKNMPMPAAAKK
jgi:hypothetical protein